MKRLNLILLILFWGLAPLASALSSPVSDMSGSGMPVMMQDNCVDSVNMDCDSAKGSVHAAADISEYCADCDSPGATNNCCQLSTLAMLPTSQPVLSIGTVSPASSTLVHRHNAPFYPIYHPPQ